METAATDKVIRSLFDRFYAELEKAGILVLNTIKISVDFSSGEIVLSDNDETISSEEVIYAWTQDEKSTPEEASAATKSAEVREYLRRFVESLMHEGYFEQPIFQTPFTVLYTDLSTEKSKPIFKADGGWTVMDKPLMKGWEKELGGFLSRLLEEKPTAGKPTKTKTEH